MSIHQAVPRAVLAPVNLPNDAKVATKLRTAISKLRVLSEISPTKGYQ